jgi:hypothetical protein
LARMDMEIILDQPDRGFFAFYLLSLIKQPMIIVLEEYEAMSSNAKVFVINTIERLLKSPIPLPYAQRFLAYLLIRSVNTELSVTPHMEFFRDRASTRNPDLLDRMFLSRILLDAGVLKVTTFFFNSGFCSFIKDKRCFNCVKLAKCGSLLAGRAVFQHRLGAIPEKLISDPTRD